MTVYKQDLPKLLQMKSVLNFITNFPKLPNLFFTQICHVKILTPNTTQDILNKTHNKIKQSSTTKYSFVKFTT